MSKRLALAIIAAAVFVHIAVGQEVRRGDAGRVPDGRGGTDQGGRGVSGGPPLQPSPQESLYLQSRLQRLDALLRQFDVNGDGTIQPTEVPAGRRRVLEVIARRVQLDPNGPIALAQLREATVRHYLEGRSSRASSPSAPAGPGVPGASSSGGAPAGGPTAATDKGPNVLTLGSSAGARGFGEAKAAPTSVAGFGAAPAPTGSTAPVSPGTPQPGAPGSATAAGAAAPAARSVSAQPPSSPPSLSKDIEQRYRRFAESLLRQYDANKNGVLDKDEWSTARPDLKAADRNNDGAITGEEMTAWLIDYSRRGASWERPSHAHSGDSPTASADGSGPRGFYRALTAVERLPDGLPDWFARKDANADGQISMAEFSASWNDQTAAEFGRYDLNNDGIITPAECLGRPGATKP